MKHIAISLFMIIAIHFFAAYAVGAQPKAEPDAAFCFVPFEWCLDGCDDLGFYVADTFPTADAAASFIAGLTPTQKATVVTSSMPQYGRRYVVAYRPLRGQVRPVETPSCSSVPVVIEVFPSIETANVELNRKPAIVRRSALVASVLPTPAYPTDGAILVYMDAAR